jgi:hypothetical protein
MQWQGTVGIKRLRSEGKVPDEPFFLSIFFLLVLYITLNVGTSQIIVLNISMTTKVYFYSLCDIVFRQL